MDRFFGGVGGGRNGFGGFDPFLMPGAMGGRRPQRHHGIWPDGGATGWEMPMGMGGGHGRPAPRPGERGGSDIDKENNREGEKRLMWVDFDVMFDRKPVTTPNSRMLVDLNGVFGPDWPPEPEDPRARPWFTVPKESGSAFEGPAAAAADDDDCGPYSRDFPPHGYVPPPGWGPFGPPPPWGFGGGRTFDRDRQRRM